MPLIKIPYGDGLQQAVIDDSIPLQIINPPAAEEPPPLKFMIEEGMKHPIGTPTLSELAAGYEEAMIIVNDHTRPGPNRELVEALVACLNEAGMSDDKITFAVATGSHRAPTAEELDQILGPEMHRRIRVHIHDCRSPEHVYLGETKEGLPIWIDKVVAEAPFIITTGLIAPHHSAGFSGGRKSIIPGVTGIDTLRIHHSLPIRPFEPAIGYYEENPFHLSAQEGALMTNVKFMINVVQDTHKNNIACVAGDLVKAHEAGVRLCRQANTITVSELADVVIVSPGGSPRDQDLYQAQKGLAVAEVFARKSGCTFILCARGDMGIGEGLFRQWLQEASTPEEVIERYRQEGFNVGNNKAFMYARALTKGRIIVVSDVLHESDLKEIMLDWAPDLQTAIDRVCAAGKPEKIIALPYAVSIIPELKQEDK